MYSSKKYLIYRKNFISLYNITMSNLLEKSTQSSNCADFLLNKKYYNAAINRAYYSSLQFVLYLLTSKFEIPFSELTPENNILTHSRAQNLLSEYLKKKSEEDFKFFQEAFLGLKSLRVKADYKEDNFDETRANKAISTALRIRKMLEINFK
jgi:uncharacterized protein (UPF0332 family)